MHEQPDDSFFDKADQNIKSAELCFEHGFYDSCVNRAYYAVYHLAIVALAKLGLSHPKNEHKWVQSSLCNEFVNKRKVFPASVKKDYNGLIEWRQFADYFPQPISKKNADKQLRRAKEILTIIKSTL